MNLPGRGAAWRAPAEAGLLAMVVALAGCSNSSTSQRASTPSRQPASTPASPPAPADSCAVITRAQAAHALGHAVGAPVRGRATVEGGVACVYYGPGAPARANPDVPLSDSVRVVLVRGAQAKGLFNDYRARVSAQPIAGLGDRPTTTAMRRSAS